MIEVELTDDEFRYASMHGIERRLKKLNGLRGDRIQKERSTLDNEIEGACAELAFCKWRGVYWTGLSKLRAKDGGFVEVRWTRHHGSGGLIVYEHDCDDTRFVLMDGRALIMRIVGYTYGATAKKLALSTEFGRLLAREALRPL